MVACLLHDLGEDIAEKGVNARHYDAQGQPAEAPLSARGGRAFRARFITDAARGPASARWDQGVADASPSHKFCPVFTRLTGRD